MTKKIFVLKDYDIHGEDIIYYFESKLTKKQINRIERLANTIYGNTSSWEKTMIFEELIKKGKLDMFEEEFDDIDLNILKESKVIQIKHYNNKKFDGMVKGYRIISPFTDKTFKKLSKRNSPTEIGF